MNHPGKHRSSLLPITSRPNNQFSYHHHHTQGTLNYSSSIPSSTTPRSAANSDSLSTPYSRHGIRTTYDNDRYHTTHPGSVYRTHDYGGRTSSYDSAGRSSAYGSSGLRGSYDSERSPYDYHLLAHREGSHGGSNYGTQSLWGDTKPLDHNKDRGERASLAQHDRDDEVAWLKEITRCTHFERDHYCKSLTHCPFFHEGIDCIRFFTGRPCVGAKCKFKHRLNLAEISDQDKGKNKDTKHKREVLKKGTEKQRDTHKDKNKKRILEDNGEISADSHEHIKRTKRVNDDSMTQIKTLHSKQEQTTEDGRNILCQPSGGVEIILPPNWRAAWSKQGEPYYYNTVTGERTWDMPVGKSPTQDSRKGVGGAEKRDEDTRVAKSKPEGRRIEREEFQRKGKQGSKNEVKSQDRGEQESTHASAQGGIGLPVLDDKRPKNIVQEKAVEKTKDKHAHKEKWDKGKSDNSRESSVPKHKVVEDSHPEVKETDTRQELERQQVEGKREPNSNKEMETHVDKQDNNQSRSQIEQLHNVANINRKNNHSNPTYNDDDNYPVTSPITTTTTNEAMTTQPDEVESGSDGGEQMIAPKRGSQLHPDAAQILTGTPILTHLLHPALSELVAQLQLQSTSIHKKPKTTFPSSVFNPLNSSLDSSSHSSPNPSSLDHSFPNPSSNLSSLNPSLDPDNLAPSTIAKNTNTLTCLQCSMLPTISTFTMTLQTNLRNHCCLNCIKKLEQGLVTTKLHQLHIVHHLYDSAKTNQALVESIDCNHNTLVDLYKKSLTACAVACTLP